MEVRIRMRKAFHFALMLLFLPSFLCAFADSDEDEASVVVLPSTAVVNHDFFAYGKTVEVSGTVNGDVYVFGGQVFIDGVVNGDVLVAGGSVEISGKVSKNVRLLSGQASISGTVGRNVTALTATIEFAPSSRVGQNIVVVSGNVDIESIVANNARIYASNLRVSDGIGGRLYAYVASMRITSKAKIDGGVEYWSNKNAVIDPHAKISGDLIHHPSFFYSVFHGKVFKSLKIGSKFAALVMNFFYTLVIALIMMRYFPQRISGAVDALNHKIFPSLLAGIVIVFILRLLFLALLITIVGVPFALTLLAINVISFYTAKIFSIIWLAKHIFCRFDFNKHRRLYFAFALIIYYLLTLIPYFGTVVSIAALLLGLGGLVLGKMDQGEKKKVRI
jgi:cytoskeletal protein CcmA (bactofilin family)